MHDLTAFQRDMLWTVLELGDPKGLTIKRELAALYGNEINHGRLYPNLDELADRDLLEKGEQDKRTNYYRVTDAGEDLLRERYEWQQEKLGVRE